MNNKSGPFSTTESEGVAQDEVCLLSHEFLATCAIMHMAEL